MTLLRAKRPDALAPGLPRGDEGGITADDIARGRPDPGPCPLAAREPRVDPARRVEFEDAPAGLRAGRSAGVATVASATAHQAQELDADRVVEDLSALSVLVTDAGVENSVLAEPCPPLSAIRTRVAAPGPRSALLLSMTTTSSSILATEATTTPGARCMCRMCAC